MASEIVGGYRENNGGDNNRMQIQAREIIIDEPLVIGCINLFAVKFKSLNCTIPKHCNVDF